MTIFGDNTRVINAVILVWIQAWSVAECFQLRLPKNRFAGRTCRYEHAPSDGGDLVIASSTKSSLESCRNSGNDCSSSLLDRRAALLDTTVAAAATAASIIVPSMTIGFPQPTNAADATTTGSGRTTSVPTWVLEGGVEMPTIALNTVGLTTSETERAVQLAVQQGITHIDFHPGMERDGVAQFLSNGGERDDLFLNTKIRKAPPGTSPEDAAERTKAQIKADLQALRVTNVDMLMIRDSPDCNVIQAQWAVLEEALQAGTTRSIGVINFCQSALECVLSTARVNPALNYYMLHVGMGEDPRGLRTFGESRGVRTFAYGAVGEPGPNSELLSNPIVQRIAKSHQKSSEEVALRWVLQTGAAASVRPTTNFGLGYSTCSMDNDSCEIGIKARASIFHWSLRKNEMAQLSKLTSPDDNPTLFSSSGCPGAFVMPPT